METKGTKLDLKTQFIKEKDKYIKILEEKLRKNNQLTD